MTNTLRVGLLIAVAALLAGCDKCGDWVTPGLPKPPASCTGDRG